MSNRVKALFFIAFNLIVAIGLLEGVFLVLLHLPGVTARSPRSVQRLVQQI